MKIFIITFLTILIINCGSEEVKEQNQPSYRNSHPYEKQKEKKKKPESKEGCPGCDYYELK